MESIYLCLNTDDKPLEVILGDEASGVGKIDIYI